MVRGGANPRGGLTSWGILGGVYAKDNYIHGDAANPASNSVEQVGMYMISPDNSTQTANTFERLDKGIEAGVDNWFSGQERDISGNLFRDVVKGISFFTPYYYTTPIGYRQLHIRCNSFESPANLAGAVALDIEGPTFPAQIGDAANGNGNRFVTPGLPSIEPIGNNLGLSFDYWRFGSSTQENFSQASANQTYQVRFTGGNPVTACTSAGYNNGINNRSAVTKPSISQTQIQNAYDSLGLISISTIRQHTLLNTLFAATTQHQDFAGLEDYQTSLPLVSNEVHAQLGTWLLRSYRAAHREPDAQRMRVALLTRHPADPEVSSFVRLSDVLMHLAQRADPLHAPAPADVTALRQVAASGTAAARVACPIARRYEPACPCLFSTQKTLQALAQRSDFSASKRAFLEVPYPNPASEWVRIAYSLLRGEENSARLEMCNALGQIVWSELLLQHVGEKQIKVSQLPAGLYQVAVVVNGQKSAVQRFAVTH